MLVPSVSCLFLWKSIVLGEVFSARALLKLTKNIMKNNRGEYVRFNQKEYLFTKYLIKDQ